MQFKDYYKTLGVEPTASDAEIKSAYRRLARKFHPDVSKETGAEEKFKAINEAYEVLKDHGKRNAYDQLKAGGYRGGEDFRPPPGWAIKGASTTTLVTAVSAIFSSRCSAVNVRDRDAVHHRRRRRLSAVPSWSSISRPFTQVASSASKWMGEP